MKHLATVLLCIASLPPVASAQEAQPDTLDWHGYFPLEVGNRWQYYGEAYQGSIGTTDIWYENWYVLGDTTIEAESYYILEIRCDSVFDSGFPDGPGPCNGYTVERSLIRYTQEAANIIKYAPEEEARDRFWFRYDFRLDAPFNSSGSSPFNLGAGYEYGSAD